MSSVPHSQKGSERKSLQIKEIPWGPPDHQNKCPHMKISPLLLFRGQTKIWDFLLLSFSIIMVNRLLSSCSGQEGIMGPLCLCPNSKKPMKKVPGASHGAPY
ncbi:unnamed protein product [Staurois parvus]|uniref:Uncharacterized protein n=1 Tax=Staurois parvus TaxID=386267 RepID=A0ABN9CQ59_9NEOB|nr:unnamed protein product [Staurois parvus]